MKLKDVLIEAKIGDKRKTGKGSDWLAPGVMHHIRQHAEKTNAMKDKREAAGKEQFSNLSSWQGRAKAKGADITLVNKRDGSKFYNAKLNGKNVGEFNCQTKMGTLKESKMSELDLLLDDMVESYVKWLSTKHAGTSRGTINATYGFLRNRKELIDTYGKEKLNDPKFIDFLRKELGQKAVEYRKENNISIASMG